MRRLDTRTGALWSKPTPDSQPPNPILQRQKVSGNLRYPVTHSAFGSAWPAETPDRRWSGYPAGETSTAGPPWNPSIGDRAAVRYHRPATPCADVRGSRQAMPRTLPSPLRPRLRRRLLRFFRLYSLSTCEWTSLLPAWVSAPAVFVFIASSTAHLTLQVIGPYCQAQEKRAALGRFPNAARLVIGLQEV